VRNPFETPYCFQIVNDGRHGHDRRGTQTCAVEKLKVSDLRLKRYCELGCDTGPHSGSRVTPARVVVFASIATGKKNRKDKDS